MNQNENAVVTITLLDPDTTAQNKIFVTINGQDWQRNLSEIGLTFDSSESEIMNRIVPMIEEEFNQNIENLYKIRKATNNQNIYIIPSSTAGI